MTWRICDSQEVVDELYAFDAFWCLNQALGVHGLTVT